MSSPAEYRQRAAECLRLSGETEDREVRAIYVTLAQSWIALATRVEGGRRSRDGQRGLPRRPRPA